MRACPVPVSARQVSPQPCALCRSGGLRVHATRGVCIYAVGSQSCAARRDRLRCARLAAAKLAAHGTSGVRRARDRSRPRTPLAPASRFALRAQGIPRSPRRRSRRLRGVSRRDASSVEYNLLASRRAPPRMRRTASSRVAQLGARPLAALPQVPIGAILPLRPARLRLRLRRLVSGASGGAGSAASEECGFAGVGGAMYAASGISRGMAG